MSEADELFTDPGEARQWARMLEPTCRYGGEASRLIAELDASALTWGKGAAFPASVIAHQRAVSARCAAKVRAAVLHNVLATLFGDAVPDGGR